MIADVAKRSARRGLRALTTRMPIRGRHRLVQSVGTKLMPSEIEHVTIGTIPFPIDHSVEAYRYIYYGLYEEGFVHLLRRVLRPGDRCIDAGANVGYITAVMADGVGSEGKVFAFEPSATCEPILRSVFEHVPQVEYVAGAVSSATGVGTFYDTPRVIHRGFACLADVEVPEDGVASRVPTWALDDFCEKASIDHLRFVKLDIEGAEILALRGAAGLLQSGSIDLVSTELSDEVGRYDAEISEALKGFGYAPSTLTRSGRLIPTDEIRPSSGTRDIIWRSPGVHATSLR